MNLSASPRASRHTFAALMASILVAGVCLAILAQLLHSESRVALLIAFTAAAFVLDQLTGFGHRIRTGRWLYSG